MDKVIVLVIAILIVMGMLSYVFSSVIFGPDPKVGDKWAMADDIKNPFTDPDYIVITEVKDGWISGIMVRMEPGSRQYVCYRKIFDLKLVYRKIK